MSRTKIKTKGLDGYIKALSEISDNTQGIVKKAVFEGSKIVADKIRENINALPVDESWGTPKNKKHGVTKIEKEGLEYSFGVSEMENDKGFINTLISFRGYNDKNKANLMIARATQSGTSFSDKIPFFDNAVRSSKMMAQAAMELELKKEIDRILNNK